MGRAMDIINAHRAGNRRLSLIWTCRDASLLEYYLRHGQFDKDGWTLVYYTGKRKLAVELAELPETLCIFCGRPCWEVVVGEIVTSIETGTGLPEQGAGIDASPLPQLCRASPHPFASIAEVPRIAAWCRTSLAPWKALAY